MDIDEKKELIMRNTEEIVSLDSLNALLSKKKEAQGLLRL